MGYLRKRPRTPPPPPKVKSGPAEHVLFVPKSIIVVSNARGFVEFIVELPQCMLPLQLRNLLRRHLVESSVVTIQISLNSLLQSTGLSDSPIGKLEVFEGGGALAAAVCCLPAVTCRGSADEPKAGKGLVASAAEASSKLVHVDDGPTELELRFKVGIKLVVAVADHAVSSPSTRDRDRPQPAVSLAGTSAPRLQLLADDGFAVAVERARRLAHRAA